MLSRNVDKAKKISKSKKALSFDNDIIFTTLN